MFLFFLIYIAILYSLNTIFKYTLILHYFLPLIALVITGIIYFIYVLVNRPKIPLHKVRNHFPTQKETEEERKARVNAEVDKIIEQMRNKD